MANKYDDSEGVWRTIGGRRVFIRTGQSLSDAMKESGKFNTKKKEETKKDDGVSRKDLLEQRLEKVQKQLSQEHSDGVDARLNEEREKILEQLDAIEQKNAKEEYIGDIPKKSYDIADEIEEKFGDKEVITRDEFEEFLTGKYDDEDADVRGILAQNGWETKFESDDEGNEGDLVRLKEDAKPKFPTTEEAIANLENARKEQAKQQAQWDKQVEDAKANSQFDVSDLKKKAQEILPKEDIDTHYGDLYLKKTPQSEALLKNMKDADSDLISTFKDQQTGETWYDVPFGNWEDNYKEQTSKSNEVNFKDFDGERDLKIGDTYITASGDLVKVLDRPYGNQLEKKLTKAFMPGQQDLKGTKWEVERLRTATDEDYATYPSIRNANKNGYYTNKLKSTLTPQERANVNEVMTNKDLQKQVAADVAKSFGAKQVKVNGETIDLTSNSGQERISDNVKVMRYGDDYVVLKNGHNEKEFKSQSDAESYAKQISKTTNDTTSQEYDAFKGTPYERKYKSVDEAIKDTNSNMNKYIREKASKKSTFKDDLPKHTEIKTQGTSNRKEVSENIQAYILDHYTSDYTGEDISPQEAFIRQMEYMNEPTMWKAGQTLAEGGSYDVYTDDMRKFLNDLKINPQGKDFDDDKVFQTYSSLIGRESAKLYDRLQKNAYNKYKSEHPLTRITFEEFKNRKDK